MPIMMIPALATSFFFGGVPPTHARALAASAPANILASHAHARPALLQRARAPPPMAFDGAFFDLTDVELLELLKKRGVVHADGISRAELVELLKETNPSSEVVLSSAAPFVLAPTEAARVSVFEKVSPAVAFIQVSVGSINPFALNRPSESGIGAGSGFLWDEHGHVVTNYHVISAGAGGPPGMGRPGRGGGGGKVTVKVKLAGMTEAVQATVVGHEADKDLAVLKVEPSALPDEAKRSALTRGSSSSLKVGQDVLAIGNPFGLDLSLTRGIVSALGRDINGFGGRPIKDCVQTDAAINPGNSGGPLLDSAGRLIGVNTMIYAPGGQGGNVGIGFAVPVDTVKRIVTQIISTGGGGSLSTQRPSIGVSVLPDALREQYAKRLGREMSGALIAEVVDGSPAARLAQPLAPCVRKGAGIVLGDLITAVNGTDVRVNEDLLCAVEEAEPGEPITLTVMRACDPERVEEVVITPVPRKALSQ